METVHDLTTDLTLHIKNQTRLQKVIYFIVRNKLQMLQDLTGDLQCDTQNIMQKAPLLIDKMNEQWKVIDLGCLDVATPSEDTLN